MTIDLIAWRLAAAALATYACGGAAGRSKDDPVYRAVTEGRDGPSPLARAGYSSCGDLGHWLLFRLGVRESFINRTEASGWRTGANISRLAWSRHARDMSASWPDTGDVCLIWNLPSTKDAHCLVVLDGGATANYGAGGMLPTAWPGAKLAPPGTLHRTETGAFYAGQRRVQRVISLGVPGLLPGLAAPDLRGAGLSGGVIDAIEKDWAAAGRNGMVRA